MSITGLAEVQAKLRALGPKLEKSIYGKAMTKANKMAIKEIRAGVTSALPVIRKFVTVSRQAKSEAKTGKGQLSVAATQAMQDLRKSIGVRKFPRSRMRDKGIIFQAVGPRSGFKIRNTRTSKREMRAATRVARDVEQGTSYSTPYPFTRRAMGKLEGPYQAAMITAARDLIAKASNA